MENTSPTDFLTEALGKWTKLAELIQRPGLSGISVNKTASRTQCALCLIPGPCLALTWIFAFTLLPSNYPWLSPQATSHVFSPGLPCRGTH